MPLDVERILNAARKLAAAKRELAAVNDANVHLKTHHELVEIEKMILEKRVALLRAQIVFDDLVAELAKEDP